MNATKRMNTYPNIKQRKEENNVDLGDPTFEQKEKEQNEREKELNGMAD